MLSVSCWWHTVHCAAAGNPEDTTTTARLLLGLVCMLIGLASSVAGYAFAALHPPPVGAAGQPRSANHTLSNSSQDSDQHHRHHHAFPKPASTLEAELLLYVALALVCFGCLYLSYQFYHLPPPAAPSASPAAAAAATATGPLSSPGWTTATGVAEHHQQQKTAAVFLCPCTPLIPVLGIMANGYLMGQLPWPAWVRLGGLSILCLLLATAFGGHRSAAIVAQRKVCDLHVRVGVEGVQYVHEGRTGRTYTCVFKTFVTKSVC